MPTSENTENNTNNDDSKSGSKNGMIEKNKRTITISNDDKADGKAQQQQESYPRYNNPSHKVANSGSHNSSTDSNKFRDAQTQPIKQIIEKSPEDEELIRLALHRNSYFTCMDEEQIERFIKKAQLRTFRPGTAVILEGSRDDIAPAMSLETTASKLLEDDSFTVPDSDALYDILDPVNDDLANEIPSMEENQRVDGFDDADDHVNLFRHHTLVLVPEYDDSTMDSESEPQEPKFSQSQSSTPPLLYVIRHGKADVLYDSMNPASLGPGNLIGEGGFLFEREHSATVVAATPLECWVVDYDEFKREILPSEGSQRLFERFATKHDETGLLYMSVEDCIRYCFDDKSQMERRMTKKIKQPAAPTTSDKDAKPSNVAQRRSFANTLRLFLRSSPSSSSSSSSSPSTVSSSSYTGEYRIYLPDFCLFQLFMARPDPEIDIVFLLMDKRKRGAITRTDFEEYLRRNFPFFDPKSEFVDRHFAANQVIRPYTFAQFLGDLKYEIGKQDFLYRARQSSRGHNNEECDRIGYLSPIDFVDVLKKSLGRELPSGIVDRLEALYCTDPVQSAESTAIASVRSGTMQGYASAQVKEYSSRSVTAELEHRENKLGTLYFSFQDFTAFQEVLCQLRGICNLIERACYAKAGSLSPDDLKVANQILGACGELNRTQVDIIFQLFDLDRDGYISTEDALSICGMDTIERLEAVPGRHGRATFSPPPSYLGPENDFRFSKGTTESTSASDPFRAPIFEDLKEFMIIYATGIIGVALVYPLDLVKTRMMNQRAGIGGKLRYSQSMDCLRRAVLGEGLLGLYGGLLPACLASGPEKYIKFAVADLLRGLWNRDANNGQGLHWAVEATCGGFAGACQLLVTNPMEITKIRMQIQGETATLFRERGLPKPKALSFSEIVRGLGPSGLYKGAAACLLRDIPFGAIYFPVYAKCKDYLAYHGSESGAVSAAHILLAGTIAGVPASFLTTPADVIKTRLQVVPRLGEAAYSGLSDCIRKIYKSEGPTAFFKGSLFRVCRIAPQFGISLLCYEKISEFLGYQGHPKPPTNAYVQASDYKAAFPRNVYPRNAISRNAHETETLIEKLGLGPRQGRNG